MKSFDQKTVSPVCWDVNIKTLDPSRYKRFVIERVLQYGRPEQVRWLCRRYSKKEISAVVRVSRNIGRKTAAYWSLHLNIPRKKVLCLNRRLMNECFA
jgi:hypothetical protein